MDFRQVIFWAWDTSIDGTNRRIQVRATRSSRNPFKGRRRGMWTTGATYVLDDFVADPSGNGIFWLSKTTNTATTPTEGSDWTRMNRFDWADEDPTRVLILPGMKALLVGVPGPISAHPTKEQGKLTPASRELVLADRFSVDGAVDGTGALVGGTGHIDWLATNFKTFLNQLFDEPDALTTWHFLQPTDMNAVATDYADKTKFNLYFTAHSKNSLYSGPDLVDMAQLGVNALQIHQTHVTLDDFVSLSQTFTVRDFLDCCKESDMHNGAPTLFAVNYVLEAGVTIPAGNGIAPGLYKAVPGEWGLENVDLAAQSINVRGHLMLYSTAIAKMAAIMGVVANEAHWTTKARTWTDTTDQTTAIVSSAPLLVTPGLTLISQLGVNFEVKFGIDPRCEWTVAQYTSDATFGWDVLFSTVLEKWARTFFCKIEHRYDQTAKQPEILFLDLLDVPVVATDATTAAVSSVDTSIQVTSAPPLLAASDIIELTDGVASEYAIATLASGTTLTITRPNPLDWPSAGVTVNAVKKIPGIPKWKLSKSSKEQTTIAQGHVEVKAMSDGDILACAGAMRSPINGEALSIEMSERTKALGPLGSRLFGSGTFVNASYGRYNESLTQDVEYSTWDFYAGGRNGHLVEASDAVITLHAAGSPMSDYKLVSPSSTFWGVSLNSTSFTLADGGDAILFPNHWGTTGIVLDVPDQNTLIFRIPTDASILTDTKFSVGYNQLFGDCVVTDGSNAITSASIDWSTNVDIYGASLIGQQLVIPSRGVFTLVSVDAGNHHMAYLDRAVFISGTGILGCVGGPTINPDAWLVGAFMYYHNDTDRRFIYPYYETPFNNDPFNFRWYSNIIAPATGFFAGAYSVSRLCYGAPEGSTSGNVVAPDDAHGCESYTAAQLYASLYIGNFVNLVLTFDGVTAEDGFISSVTNGSMFYEQRDGAVRFFQMLGHDPDEFALGSGSTTVYAIEKKNSSPLTNARFPVVKKGTGGSTGGASSVGGAGSGSSGGGTSTVTSSGFPFVVLTGTGIIVIPATNTKYLCNDTLTTGVTKPVAPKAGDEIYLMNRTSTDWTLATGSDFYLAINDSWHLLYDGTAVQSDPTLPAGWSRVGFSG